MARHLANLGRASYRHRWPVLIGWMAALAMMAFAAASLHKPTSDAFNVPGTESQQALDLLDAKFPGAGGATARLVFAAPSGHTLTEARYRQVVEPTVELAQRVPQSVGSGKAFKATLKLSPDHRIAFADLHFLVSVDKLKDSTKAALNRVADPARKAGLEVEFSGGVTSSASSSESNTEMIGLIVAFVILLVAFGTAFAAVLPLVTALVGVAMGMLGISAVSGLTTLNSTAPTLATMLGLAVGIDYSLFIVSRHRQQLLDGLAPADSVALAVGTAGSAVCFAGLTVIIALVGVLVVGIPFLSVMGLAAAGTVLVEVVGALTLLPALLSFLGPRVAGGRQVHRENPMGARWARLVTRRPIVTIAGVTVLLLAIAIPATQMRTGLPADNSKPKNSTEYRSYQLLAKGFGPGFAGPLLIVGDARGNPNPKHAIAKAVSALGKFPNVAAVSPPVFNRDGRIAVVTVAPRSGPDSQKTVDLVSLIRSRARQAAERYGLKGYVTGTTALNIDTSNKISAGLPTFLILIVGLAMVLLALAFRSIAIPIKAVAGFLLTIASALGVTTLVFQQGHGAAVLGVDSTSPIVSFLPVLLISILFGLAMDYEVFLVSRIRESYVEDPQPLPAIINGFRASARVVTAAALIMFSVFTAFIAGDNIVVKSIAFALAFGVLADAFLVRMTLVPAVLALLRGSAWKLPRRIDRRMPNLDIEGKALGEAHAVRAPAAP
jgi:putative drug exporter of the RND superfamily